MAASSGEIADSPVDALALASAASVAASASASSAAAAPAARDYSSTPALLWFALKAKYAGALKAEDVPGPRAAHSCNLIGSKLYVFGGWNGKSGLNQLHVLDVDTLEWSAPATTGVTPSARNNHATFTFGSKLAVHGGHDGVKWLADLHILDVDKMEWSQPVVAGIPPSARACHTCTLLQRRIWMFGGYDGTQCFNSLDVLDLDTMTWIQPRLQGTVPQARNAQTVTPVGNKLLLFGGHSGNKHLRDLHILDTETMAWSSPEVKGHVPPGLRGHTANLIGHKIFLYGGYDGRGRSNELYLLDTRTFRWEHPSANESTPAGRQRHTACLVHNKKLFVIGGFDGFKWLNDVHVLDVGKLEESALTTASVTSLLDDLHGIVNNPEAFPDVTFIVDKTPVYAHKAILCARSEHFRRMFTSGMRESHASEISFPVREPQMVDWPHAAFVAMLEFLYTGSVRELTATIAVDALGLADHSGIDGLKALCETTLIHSVDAANVCTLISTAHRHGAPELKRFCMDFILKHSEAVQLDHLAAEPSLLVEITREVISRNSKSS